jgi:hypothetical protein
MSGSDRLDAVPCTGSRHEDERSCEDPVDLPKNPDTTPEALPHNIEAEQQLLGAILSTTTSIDRIAAW